jgi:hypothetical protein
MPSPNDLTHEFDILMQRAGIRVPDARRAAVLASYADLCDQIALLHNRIRVYRRTSQRLPPVAAGGR